MSSSTAQGQHDGVRFHRRYLKPAPFVVAAFMTLGFGAGIIIVHSGISTLLGLIIIFTFLAFSYVDGPAKSVTVRQDTVEVRNTIHRYVIPVARILSIEYVSGVGVLIRMEGDKSIWVGAFCRSQIRWRLPSAGELRANAESLSDALPATPASADQRQVKRGYRWVNIFLVAACLTALVALDVVLQNS